MNTQLTKNQKYKAMIKLGVFESWAPNQMVEEKLKSAGFVNVSVNGTGVERIAIGTWPKENQTADIPKQIIKIETI